MDAASATGLPYGSVHCTRQTDGGGGLRAYAGCTEKALQAARLHCAGKLWCVFGCGGDRDKGKRPLMGAIAEEFADVVVVTDDNPRTEEPRAIINDILAGMLDAGYAKVMEGRAEAVTCAVMQAKENDVVLVAGKGHEDYQIVGNQRLDYSDRVTVARLLGVIA